MNAAEFEGPLGSILRTASAGLARIPHPGWLVLMAIGCFMAWKGISRIPEHYKAIGRLECHQATTSAAAGAIAHQAAAVVSQAASAVAHAQATGQQAERSRSRVNAHFNRLNEEARHDPIDPVDSCVLPAARLRRWASANAGDGGPLAAIDGAPTGQPDDGASTPSTAGIRPHDGPGGEPSGRRPGLSPAGQPALPPAQVPGVRP